MPFKIVETYEKDHYELTICPSTWESHGILYWPKKKAKKQIRIEDSQPKSDWSIMKCFVKRQDIPTYNKAEQELQDMLNCTTTDPEQAPIFTATVKNLAPQIQDFNKKAEQVPTSLFLFISKISQELRR